MEIDIFAEDKPQPKIYVADIEIEVKTPVKKIKVKRYDISKYTLEKISCVMNDGDIASQQQKRNLFKMIFKKYIGKGDFDELIFSITKISNVKFLSNLSYKFDYNKH
jgi:hypothetical protein